VLLHLILGCSDAAGPEVGSEVDDPNIRIPPSVTLDLPLTGIAASGGHTCAVSWNGKAYCWGANTYGELGDSTSIASPVPVAVRTATRFVAVSVDGFIRWPEYGVEPHPWAAYTCGLDGTGTAHCWGDMTYGQLGTGQPCPDCRWLDALTPQPVLGGPYRQVSVGDRHACAITAGGAVYCWGDRSGVAGGWNRPNLVPDPGGKAILVSAGGDHTCIVTTSSDAFCWGSNRWGQIGTGVSGLHERQVLPARVILSDVSSISAGDNGTCALTRQGEAYCWGRNDAGQLGNGSVQAVCKADNNTFSCPTDPAGPQRVSSVIPLKVLAVGQFHACALDLEGRAWCWGAAAQSGRRSGDLTLPGPVETDRRFRELVAGARHTCGITLEGTVYCWGEGRFGQLGNGSRMDALLPTEIANRS
jgi:alpha-tubulin suppressor-like RCC1 family protein